MKGTRMGTTIKWKLTTRYDPNMSKNWFPTKIDL
jgi:hypothetical protein